MQATRRVGVLALTLALAWVIVGVVLLDAIRPPGPLSFGPRRGWANAIVPEYWAFFTRDPTVEFVAFRRDSRGRWVSAAAFTYGSLRNWFGWRREGRSEAYDLDTIVGRVSSRAWRACGDASRQCIEGLSRPLEIDLYRPVLCGQLGLMRVYPVPWELARRRHPPRRADAVLVTVPCRR